MLRSITISHISVLFPLMFSCICSAGTISIAPTHEDVGTVGINVTSTDEAYFNISNIAGGNNDLTIFSVTSDNPDFVVVQPSSGQLPRVIPAGETFLIWVAFTPSSNGVKNANITVLSDDAVNSSVVVTATGYGGLEQSIELFPKNIEIENGQGKTFRAEVIFDNGASGPAQLNWSSSSTSVATAAAAGIDTDFVYPTALGNVESIGTGASTITVSGVNNPSVSTTTSVTVVSPSPLEFIGASTEDRINRINAGAHTLCYDFPETDVDSSPLYSVNQVGVTTVGIGQIGDIYVAADSSAGNSEEIFHFPNDCAVRTNVFNMNSQNAVFSDLVVDSNGRAIAANLSNSNLWQVEPGQSPVELVATGLPLNDIGALAIDAADNVYTASLVQSTSEQHAAVYVRPVGVQQWFPVATVFNTLDPSSFALPGIAAIKLDNQGYAMKLVDWDKSIVEKYVDLDEDGNFYEIVGTTFVPDPGEIVEVANITAGVDINVDPERNLVVSVGEANGRNLVRMTDLNADGDFNDAQEQRVIYQSNSFTNLVDVSFATPCNDLPPQANIGFLPPSGVVDLDEDVYLLGGGSSDPCNDTLSYEWDFDGDGTTDSTAITASTSYPGPPDLHSVSLTVTDPRGNTNTAVGTVKAGPPLIDGFWPSTGVQGDFIFVFGKNYQTASGFPTVCFNGNCTFITQVVAPDLLISQVPAGDTEGPISITTIIGSTSSSTNWGGTLPPNVNINGIWPAQVSVSDVVFVFGSGFSTNYANMQVTINGVPIFSFQPNTADMFLILVPSGVTSGQVCVTVAGNTACSEKDLIIQP